MYNVSKELAIGGSEVKPGIYIIIFVVYRWKEGALVWKALYVRTITRSDNYFIHSLPLYEYILCVHESYNNSYRLIIQFNFSLLE